MLAPLNSESAISAALRIDWPAMPALPPADSGRITPTLTPPPVLPVVVPSGAEGTAAVRAAPGPATIGAPPPNRLVPAPQPARPPPRAGQATRRETRPSQTARTH